MSARLRVVTFNLENLDDRPGRKPTLAQRIAVMRPQLVRLDADILCLQEVNGQEQSGYPRRLLALDELLEDTAYEDYHRVSTMTVDGEQVYNERNLVVVSRFPVVEHDQYKHEFALAPALSKGHRAAGGIAQGYHVGAADPVCQDRCREQRTSRH